jgi:photosystem II stability/assembly factor-like uncharacterized protein
MKNKIYKILCVVLTLALLSSFVAGLATPAAAADGAWTKFLYPRAGGLSGYVLTPFDTTRTPPATTWSAGPGPIQKAINGDLYAYWDVGEATNLYKSTDGARSWTRCDSATGPLHAIVGTPLVAIACSPQDAKTVYVTDDTTVFKSADAGATFSSLMAGPWASGTITCMDIGYNSGSHWIVVGTASSTGGEVYLKSDVYGSAWAAQNVQVGQPAAGGPYNVMAVACSPNFATEAKPQIVAVITGLSGTRHTYVTYQYGGGAWNAASSLNAELKYNPAPGTPFGVVRYAAIAFPADYNSTYGARDLFVAVDDAVGTSYGADVYHVSSNAASDLDIGGANTSTRVGSIALGGSSGNCKLLAGDFGTPTLKYPAAGAIWYSTDSGSTWLNTKKAPSGDFPAYVVCASDYFDSGKAWVATGDKLSVGEGSAISLTNDWGKSWSQISLINTDILQINTLAFSPNYASDTTMFMITKSATKFPGVYSVWRCDGTYWERVHDNITFAMTTIDKVACSPAFATDKAVFIAQMGTPPTGPAPKIWRSTDSGRWFQKQIGAPTAFGPPGASWIILDSSTIIVGNGTNATITTNNGTTWSDKPLPVVTTEIVSFAKSPTYATDSTLLCGSDSGYIFRSTDGGNTWSSIPAGVPITNGGPTFVCFDQKYATNSTVYATDQTTNGVYRLVYGTDTSWKRIDTLTATTWPASSTVAVKVTGIVAAPDGDGTVLYVGDTGAGTYNPAVLRSVNPTASTALTSGVYFEPMSYGFTETQGCYIGPWYTSGPNTLWMLESVPKSTVNAIWTYTDKLTLGPTLTSPANGGSTGSTTTATLSWGALPTATYYEVWVSTDPGFSTYAGGSGPVTGVTTATSWTTADLIPGTKYYWMVCSRAAGSTQSNFTVVTPHPGHNISPWSAEWNFTTMAKPIPPSAATPPGVIPPAPAPTTPAWIWAIVIIVATLVIAVIVVIVTTRRVP